jgi:GNAT superfamily N-acetyltransferase
MAEARITDPGALLATTHAADGGLRVRLRLARPSDGPRVRDFLQGISPQRVSDSMVRRFVFGNPRERLVVAATAPLDGADEVVGLADVTFGPAGVADLGVVVDGRTRNRGVGKLLTEAIASLALQQGVDRLRAELPQAQGPVRHLMERLGSVGETVEDGTRVLYTRLPDARNRAA